ncbi:MAG: hypothetical protein JZU65_19465 [Chlorobium sp.]|jgi:hypothetical protein|nr:hypothetical protein [Chlorobium sp.]
MENTAQLPAEIATAKLVEIVQTAPAIFIDNKTRHDKAITYGENLLNKVEEVGMNEEMDTLLADYQAKIRVTYKTIYEARRPFTQIVDQVKKEFTSLEADIDPAGKNNIFFNIQRVRDIYVTEKVKAQKAKEAEALRLQNIEREKIEIAKQVEIAINQAFGEYILKLKTTLNSLFEGMTLATLQADQEALTATQLSLPREIFDSFTARHFFVNFITPEEVNEIIKQTKSEDLFDDLNAVCQIDLKEYKRELIEKIPSKKKELEAIASASQEEAERLQKEADDRKFAEAQRLETEAAQKVTESNQEAEVTAAGKTLESTIATQAELFTEAPKTKDGYQIEVLNKAGYGLIFQFWFEKEGRNLDSEKIEKKTIGQMKKFCEDLAIKNDEKIVSPLLKYVETYKAK